MERLRTRSCKTVTPSMPIIVDFCWCMRPDMTPPETLTGPHWEYLTTRRGRWHCSRSSPPLVSGTSSPGFAGLRMGIRWWDSSWDSCETGFFSLLFWFSWFSQLRIRPNQSLLSSIPLLLNLKPLTILITVKSIPFLLNKWFHSLHYYDWDYSNYYRMTQCWIARSFDES